MKCVNKDKNLDFCICTYPSCPRKGVCCECLKYHLSKEQLPACFFPPEAEKTYNRSREYFISLFK
jgi:hypothetical protein